MLKVFFISNCIFVFVLHHVIFLSLCLYNNFFFCIVVEMKTSDMILTDARRDIICNSCAISFFLSERNLSMLFFLSDCNNAAWKAAVTCWSTNCLWRVRLPLMACAYTERVVLSQQLITCSRELAGLAQRAAELFADLGESVSAIDSTLSRLSGRVVDLDRKVSEAKAAHDAQGERLYCLLLNSPGFYAFV